MLYLLWHHQSAGDRLQPISAGLDRIRAGRQTASRNLVQARGCELQRRWVGGCSQREHIQLKHFLTQTCSFLAPQKLKSVKREASGAGRDLRAELWKPPGIPNEELSRWPPFRSQSPTGRRGRTRKQLEGLFIPTCLGTPFRSWPGIRTYNRNDEWSWKEPLAHCRESACLILVQPHQSFSPNHKHLKVNVSSSGIGQLIMF